MLARDGHISIMQFASVSRFTSLGVASLGVVLACSSGDGGGGTSPVGAAGSGGSGSGLSGNSAAGSSVAGTGTTMGGTAGASAGGQGGTLAGASSAGRGGEAAGSANVAGMSGSGAAGGAGAPNGGAAGSSNGTGGAPTAAQLLAKLGACTKVRGPFNPDGPDTGSIDVCKTGNALWWKADMDVDCDGIQTPPCNTDVTGQPQTSIVDAAPSGDVDPTKLPYFVIPLGTEQSEWYTTYGVEIGQIGAIIYQGRVIYGIFADTAGGNFIGEASYKMCSLFIGADHCDPNEGGIDPQDVTYVTFTGTAPRASGQDIYDHDKHTALGEAAAKAWLAAP